MKHVELEQFLHAFTSRGFDSVSWAFLFTWRGRKDGLNDIYSTDIVVFPRWKPCRKHKKLYIVTFRP